MEVGIDRHTYVKNCAQLMHSNSTEAFEAVCCPKLPTVCQESVFLEAKSHLQHVFFRSTREEVRHKFAKKRPPPLNCPGFARILLVESAGEVWRR